MRSWLQGRPRASASTHSLSALDEPQHLEDALRAVIHILNDDMDAAEEGLGQGQSTFHMLGRGLVAFLRATLGFEQDVMREAAERLSEAETSAWNDLRRSQRDPAAFQSSIYPSGAEFQLCIAETQLMTAVVGVLNESLTESIKGFYKLRKAYITLEGILQAENQYFAKKGISTPTNATDKSKRASVVSPNTSTASVSEAKVASTPSTTEPASILSAETIVVISNGNIGEEEDEFFDADDQNETTETSTYAGHVESDTLRKKMADVTVGDRRASDEGLFMRSSSLAKVSTITSQTDNGPDERSFDNTIDMFIHSGANVCFGLLQVLISIIPPAFARLLAIVGFRGDRQQGLKNLWHAAKFDNIHGAMAGLVLLNYYHGIFGFSDITLPGGYPRDRCEALLANMRARYPQSKFWILEEARMQGVKCRLERGVEILQESGPSKLKQVAALSMFEKSLESLYIHNYDLCAESFLACVDLNNWSHALYYFIAGAAHVELFRKHKKLDPKLAQKHADKATELFRTVPKHTGKRRLMARQLPFDAFVSRKLQKWDARAADAGCSLIDAIGVSPYEEMIYFWNGYKKMTPAQLHDSLAALAWVEDPVNTPPSRPWAREPADEKAVLALLRAAVSRTLGRFAAARQHLADGVLALDHRTALRGHLRDDYSAPCAHYEMAVVCWMELGLAEWAHHGAAPPPERLVPRMRDGDPGYAEKLAECADWIDKAAHWESYDLDARMGMKIATAQDTLKKLRGTA